MKISENALKDRIKNLAKATGKTHKEVSKRIFLERFLARVSKSSLSDKFIFKGGNLLSYYLEIGRETTDLDFLLAKIASEETAIKKALESICKTSLGDGYSLRLDKIESLDHAHMSYPGFRATINVKLDAGSLKENIHIDVGIGDKVSPESKELPLTTYNNQPLYEESVLLKVYPPEAIFAEKLETVIAKGATNSRMKDFHDLVLLSRADKLVDKDELKNSILQTFDHRGTNLNLPIQFRPVELPQLNTFWTAHGSTMGTAAMLDLNIPKNFNDAVSEINVFLNTLGLPDKGKK